MNNIKLVSVVPLTCIFIINLDIRFKVEGEMKVRFVMTHPGKMMKGTCIVN